MLEWIDKFISPAVMDSPTSPCGSPQEPPNRQPNSTISALDVVELFLRVKLLDRLRFILENANIPHTSRAKKNVFLILHTVLARLATESDGDRLRAAKEAFQCACSIGNAGSINNTDDAVVPQPIPPSSDSNIIRAVVTNLFVQDSYEVLYYGLQCLHFFDQLHEQGVLEMFRPEDNLLLQVASKGEPWLIGMIFLNDAYLFDLD
jgi:hypothetical protein